jgi:S-methylmethionine-dependent homocysteine/selenocysteine methylase
MVTILDGGMGRELKRIGAPFRQPEWSALALIEAPDFVERAHDGFVAAGADVITTNSYAVVPFHIGDHRFAAQGVALAAEAGARARASAAKGGRPVKVAGSLPPVFGSYRPDLYDGDAAPRILGPLIEGLSAHVDVWLAETQSAIAEIETVTRVLGDDARPRWFSFTIEDDPHRMTAGPILRSGEPVGEAVKRALDLGASAVLFNCSQPEAMADALDRALRALGARRSGPNAVALGVYANAFPPQGAEAEANSTLHDIRADLTPERYLGFARDWAERGATIIGGCCGIGPDHVAALAAGLR